MTVVAVKRYKTKIVISADQQISRGNRMKQVKSVNENFRDKNKIFQENGITVGSAGDVAGSIMFRQFCKTHKPKNGQYDAMIDFLVEFNDWSKKKNEDFEIDDNSFIIIYDGEIYWSSGLSLYEFSDYGAIGSGLNYAITALYLNKTPEEAVRIACEFEQYCSGEPYTVEVKL